MDGCECLLISSWNSGWRRAKGKYCIFLEILEGDGEGMTMMGFDGWKLVFMLLVKTDFLKLFRQNVKLV